MALTTMDWAAAVGVTFRFEGSGSRTWTESSHSSSQWTCVCRFLFDGVSLIVELLLLLLFVDERCEHSKQNASLRAPRDLLQNVEVNLEAY